MLQNFYDEVRLHHIDLDEAVRTWVSEYASRGGRVFCGRGCRNCCSLAVSTTFVEAQMIAEFLSPHQVERLNAHVGALLENLPQVTDLKSFLHMHRKQLGYCPFLDSDGICCIYDLRPLACRALLSTRPAEWCAVDFGEVSPFEKQLFMDSLDRRVVAYPTHYAGGPQESARGLEDALCRQTQQHFGFCLNGNLPFLVWLEREFNLSGYFPQGMAAVGDFLKSKGMLSEFLVQLRLADG